MLSNKSHRILVVTILLVFLAFFTCYCLLDKSSGRPSYLIWIEENLFGYHRPPSCIVIIDPSGSMETVDDRPEIQNGP